MVSPPRPTSTDDPVSRKEAAERAVRIAAMLDRWAAEDVSGEPDWNIEDLEPMTLRAAVATDRDKPGT